MTRSLAAGLLGIAMLVVSARPASAQGDDKKALFEKGAAHYQAEEFEDAAAAFEKLYALEASTDILFAWAQAERFSDNCEKAVGMFDELLNSDMSEPNKKAVRESLTQCRQRIEQNKASEPPPVEPDPPAKTASPPPARASTSAQLDDDSAPAWYKDPIGGSLTGAGVVGLGLGIGFYISGRSANSDADSTDSAAEFARLKDRAQSRGRIGFIGIAAGSALLAGGIVWYVLDPRGRSEEPVSAWLTGDSAGIAFGGRF